MRFFLYILVREKIVLRLVESRFPSHLFSRPSVTITSIIIGAVLFVGVYYCRLTGRSRHAILFVVRNRQFPPRNDGDGDSERFRIDLKGRDF